MLRYLSKTIGFAGYVIQYGCITHCTFEYLGDFVVCSGPSMEPTLYSNNILITERITSRVNKIQRGDIVIAKCPTNPGQHICKRIVALPGDRIVAIEPTLHNDISLGKRITNKLDENVKQKEIKIVEKTKEDPGTKSIVMPIWRNEIIIPRGHVWVEGDNTENSADSRYYGPIPQGLIKSRAICRLWPITDIKLLI